MIFTTMKFKITSGYSFLHITGVVIKNSDSINECLQSDPLQSVRETNGHAKMAYEFAI